jgi:hypothetical protein
MHNLEKYSIQRLSAQARWIGDRKAVNEASSGFASYLRAFGKFFQFYTMKPPSGTARLSRVYGVRSPLAPASVAFV